MRELFPNVAQDRKERIRREVDFFFTLLKTNFSLPRLLNEYVLSFTSIDEQEYADFVITAKFIELEGAENEINSNQREDEAR